MTSGTEWASRGPARGTMHYWWGRWALAGTFALGTLSAPPSGAFESLTFTTPGAPADLEVALRASSVLLIAQSENKQDVDAVLAAARADYQRLIGALYENGFYGGVISIKVDGQEVADLRPTRQLGSINTIDVMVDPGPLYHFSRADVVPLARATELDKDFRVGAPAGWRAIRLSARAAIDGWRDQGHAKADVKDQRIIAEHDEDTVAANVVMDPGPLVRYGAFRLAGPSYVRTERIAEITGFPTGQVFSPARTELAADRLRRTGAFQAVRFDEADQLNADDTLDMDLHLIDAKPRRFGFGAEVSSTDGAMLSAFWMHRNLFGGAERLRIDGEVSSIDGATGGTDWILRGDFRRPGTYHPDVTFFTTAELEHLEEPDFDSESAEVTLGFERIVSPELTVSGGAGVRHVSVADGLGDFDYTHLRFPLTVEYDQRDNVLNPTAGFFAYGEATPFVGLDGSASGTRFEFDGRAYRGFGASDRVVLAGRVQFGTNAGADLLEVPNDDRFYSGGLETVRGQAYQSLDFDLGGGVSSGGASIATASAEVRVAVNDKVQVVGFADYGAISRDGWFDGDSKDHSGAGIGVRYETRFGPVRLDIATPVSGGDSGDLFFYLGFGQSF